MRSAQGRQEWIESGLLELMAQNRYEDLTVTDLCRYLSMPRRSFYRYFRDLEDVLDSALDHLFQSMAMPGHLPEYEELLRNYIFWKEHCAVLDALQSSGMTQKLYDYIGRYTNPMKLEQCILPEDRELDLRREITMFTTAGSVALAIGWYQDGFRRTPEEMAKITERMLFKLEESRKNSMVAIKDLEQTKERLLSFAEYAKDA